MHPKVSKAEIEVFKALSAAGLTSGMVTQKPIVLKATIPDFCWFSKRKIVYLDSDLFFYSSVKPALEELGDKSILTVEHRFPQNQRGRFASSGRFNVAFQIYNRDKEALACLSRWRNQCLDWCYERLENNRYGDQLYLNEWPKLYQNLVISQNLGIDAAPWNIGQYGLTKKGDKIYVENDELICYHFHQFEILSESKFSHSAAYSLPDVVKRIIYKPYEEELRKQIKILQGVDGEFKIIPSKKSMTSKAKEALAKLIGPLFWRWQTYVRLRKNL